MFRLLIVTCIMAVVPGCVLALPTVNGDSEAAILTQIEKSTDQATWSSLGSGDLPGEATGPVYLMANEYDTWVGVYETVESTTTYYRVDVDFLATSTVDFFFSSYGKSVTVAWDADGSFSSVKKSTRVGSAVSSESTVPELEPHRITARMTTNQVQTLNGGSWSNYNGDFSHTVDADSVGEGAGDQGSEWFEWIWREPPSTYRILKGNVHGTDVEEPIVHTGMRKVFDNIVAKNRDARIKVESGQLKELAGL